MIRPIARCLAAAIATLVLPASAQAVEIHQKHYVDHGPVVREVVTVVHVAPRDSDDDGVANRDDDCPKTSGTVNNGCPPAPVINETASSVNSATSYVPTSSSTVQCESGGDYSANTGNGYYGGYQFDSRTWNAYGDSAYGEANEAPPAVQDAAAASVPYDAWPNC